jgi:hypothetical protein
VDHGGWRSAAKRWLAEPTLHFFLLGGLLFLAHRLVAGSPHVIVVNGGLRADFERRLRDQNGRPPTPAELTEALAAWRRDEALYREALAQGLDREDAIVRTVLADKLRARTVAELPQRQPTDAELDAYLAAHRQAYETPLAYEYELVAFPRAVAAASEQRARFARALAAGASPRSLGRPIVGATWTREDLREKLGPALGEAIVALGPGTWQPLDGEKDLLLVRVVAIHGGMPSRDEVRPRLVEDWRAEQRKQAVDRLVQDVVARYRFEERP